MVKKCLTRCPPRTSCHGRSPRSRSAAGHAPSLTHTDTALASEYASGSTWRAQARGDNGAPLN